MFLRSAIIACAAAAFAAPAFADNAPAPGCAETTFRVYFNRDSAALDATTEQMLDVAARNVAQCDYAELRVTLNGSSPYAQQRADAIRTAADERDWNAVRIEPRTMAQRASYGPEYAEVTMTPNPSTATTPLPTRTDTGV